MSSSAMAGLRDKECLQRRGFIHERNLTSTATKDYCFSFQKKTKGSSDSSLTFSGTFKCSLHWDYGLDERKYE